MNPYERDGVWYVMHEIDKSSMIERRATDEEIPAPAIPEKPKKAKK